ncbi:cobalt ABC transporter ATP-binding protein [Spirochaetia bacterium]|nr:cobalt ABC transporter ATP-binding protein [Spirochaetia bacterium]GHU34741.1 cobalt ABC transporter ATP-binding protein [Spirochaetia bacterium]
MPASVEVNDITVRYQSGDPLPVLSHLSFSLQKGEHLALTGNNGAGKSTLLLSLVGMLFPENGGIVIDGTELNRRNAALIRQKTGLVFQNPDDQLFMPTVYDDIAFGLRSQGKPETETVQKADKVLAALGISTLRERFTHRLSGGEKRLAALAGILVMEPELMLFDEPATFLDPPGRERLIEILSTLSHTMIIVTHDLDMAKRLCTRVIHLERGCLTADDTIHD